MTSRTNKVLLNLDVENSNIEDLTSSYKRMSLDLLECSQHIPGEDAKRDQEMAEREGQLLSRQDDILTRVAAVDINSNKEAGILANFWMELNKAEDNERPTDRLFMTLCQHIQTL